MKVLLTGANGYIGTRLLPALIEKGHEVVCLVRDKRRFHEELSVNSSVRVIEGDLLKGETLHSIPPDIEASYYLAHSMGAGLKKFSELEAIAAQNFIDKLSTTNCKQIIYLGGITNDKQLSAHLNSRLNVENIIKSGSVAYTILRAAIIIGSGSASFEIIRDLTEKLPIMITPKWLKTRCQPIAIRNVIQYLESVLDNRHTFNQQFDIGGPDILTYKEMLLGYANVRKLNRLIITLPVLTPRLSSYWLYFVTSTSFPLAQNLVDSMRNEVICQNTRIQQLINIDLINYEQALDLAFSKIEQNAIVSSWKDALNSGLLKTEFMNQVKVPVNGVLNYKVKVDFSRNPMEVFRNFTQIGGDRGWYYLDWIWGLRGFFDKLVGGIGTRRGRTSHTHIKAGDALDFWRVLLVDHKNMRLLLYAEMKLPGEAWLEFKIIQHDEMQCLSQIATFRPHGLWGRVYWLLMWPFHLLLFNGMANRIVNFQSQKC